MRLKKILLTAAMVCGGWPVVAQFDDSFVDGNFHFSPSWQGDVSRFTVVGERLRLQAPQQSGVASLATASKAIHEASWSFAVQFDFTPSSTNYAKVYLVADQSVLSGPLNGYFVKIGNTTREVSLYRQTGTGELEIIDGLDDRVNQPIVNIGVRVTRNTEGKWELLTEVARSGVYQSEGQATDVTHTQCKWFGVHCVYTSTRSDKFWFDDFLVVGTQVPDTTPPSVTSVEVSDQTHVKVIFSEPVNPTGIIDYLQFEDIGHPAHAKLSPDSSTLDLELSMPLVNGRMYQMSISGLADRSGNRLYTTLPVMYFKPGTPKPKSVIITEIFPDPLPQVGLPAAEYVELYNISDDPFDLGSWKLTDGSSTGIIGDVILLPQQYLVLTSSGSVASFGAEGVIGLTNFPSLNNSGDQLWLLDKKGMVIDSVSYSSAWFRDEDKQQGGWSLEMIDTSNPCGEEENWMASEEPTGGTPGRENSVKANKPDLLPPAMLDVWQQDSLHLIVSFNELLQSPVDGSARIDPETLIVGISLHGKTKREVEIQLDEVLKRGTPYTLYMSGIHDCIGNQMSDSEIRFGVPEPADSGDVKISEVLFNPRPGGTDFVELYNSSGKYIQLDGWLLGNGITATNLPRFLLHPRQWVAFSEDPYILSMHYPTSTPSQVVQSQLPSLPDDEGEVALLDPGSQEIDRLNYQQRWHSVFLRDDEGVSLERIDYSWNTQSSENWISASLQSGYATPGRENSQQRSPVGGHTRVEVIPEIVSPGDPQTDFVQIHYHFDFAGVANVKVFNHAGSLIRSIAENEWLGNEGFFRWDGDRNDGRRAAAGYYFVWFEWFDSSGNVETYRKRVIVAGY